MTVTILRFQVNREDAILMQELCSSGKLPEDVPNFLVRYAWFLFVTASKAFIDIVAEIGFSIIHIDHVVVRIAGKWSMLQNGNEIDMNKHPPLLEQFMLQLDICLNSRNITRLDLPCQRL